MGVSTKVNGRRTQWMAMVSSGGLTANDTKASTLTTRSTDMAPSFGLAGNNTLAGGRLGSSMVRVT